MQQWKNKRTLQKKVSTRQPSSSHRHRNTTTSVTSSENRATSIKAYEDEQGEQKSDYSFSDYSSNVASGTEDRGYGAAYDEDVLGLSD